MIEINRVHKFKFPLVMKTTGSLQSSRIQNEAILTSHPSNSPCHFLFPLSFPFSPCHFLFPYDFLPPMIFFPLWFSFPLVIFFFPVVECWLQNFNVSICHFSSHVHLILLTHFPLGEQYSFFALVLYIPTLCFFFCPLFTFSSILTLPYWGFPLMFLFLTFSIILIFS